jgi:hypothetical protein
MNEMTCREFDEIVHGFVRMELLDVNLREAALEHAAHCEPCSQQMADAAALAEVSEMVGKEALAEQTPPRVEAALMAAFRSHHRRATWRRTLEWASVGAAAAVLLIFLWTARGHSSRPLPPTPAPKSDASSKSPTPLDARGPEASKQNPIVPKQDEVGPNTSTAEPYVASDFVPVPYTGAISSDDPGMVVRVQLTRSSLAQLGYPVAETPDEDLIFADVLVGEDGWPRGVKLIQ